MRSKRVLVNVCGAQISDGERDETEVDLVGELCENKGEYIVRYTEYDENQSKTETAITVAGGCVSVAKTGELTTKMQFESGKRFTCNYATPYGMLTMGVFSEKVSADMCFDGGKIELIYNIDFNTGFVSENVLTVTVRNAE